MDIVNPIPPRKPAPITCLKVSPEGNCVAFSFTDKYENNEIPIGFPKTSPAKIP